MATKKKVESHVIEIGSFRHRLKANELCRKAQKAGIAVSVAVKEAGSYKVRTAALSGKDLEDTQKKLEDAGIEFSLL